MIRTVDDMYTRFLYGIDKEGTTTVYPEKFNELINETQGLVVNEFADEVQVNRRRLDDLAPIMRTYSNKTTTVLPVGDPVVTYPKTLPIDYFRELNVLFEIKVRQDANGYRRPPLATESYNLEKKWGKILRSDNKPIALSNPYRDTTAVDKEGFVYYEVQDNVISTIHYDFREYIMEYLIVPPAILFNESGTGHIHCVFSPRMQQIIVDRAIRIFIERTENPRYQTALNEDRSKNL